MPDYAFHTSGFIKIDGSGNDKPLLKTHSNFQNNENNPFSDGSRQRLSAGFSRAGEWYIGLLFLIPLIISSGLIYCSVPENRLTLLLGNIVLTVICAVIGVLFVRSSRKYILKLVEEGVYDAILAGVDVIDSMFFLIVDNEGKLIYADAQYKKYFGDPAAVHLDYFADFLQKGIIAPHERQAIEAVLAAEGAEQAAFTVLTEAGETLSLVLTVKSVDIREALKYSGSLQKAYMLRKCFRGRQKCFLIKAMAGESVQDTQKQFLDNLPIGVYAATDTGELSYYNKAFSTILGYEASDTLPLVNITEWLIEQECNSDSLSPVIHIRKKDGEIVQLLSRPLWGGEQQGGRGSYTMLMQLQMFKENSGRAQGESDSLADFLESSPVAQVILTEKGDIKQSNAVFHALMGREGCGAGNALNLLDTISEKSRNDVQTYIHQASVGSEVLKPLDIQLIGEKEMTALLYMKRLSGTKEGEQRLICHLIDTTEQKNLELRFVHSQKMQAVGQLAGGIAHDFNNLLTAMIGFCDLLLLRHPAGDQSFADLMQIKQNTNRAANLVRQLLAFSRKQTLQPEILDITGVLAELSSLVRRLIGENIDLKVHHGQDLWLVKVDQGQLDQVMINLAVNARDAMNGGGVLTIKSSNVTVGSGQLLKPELIPPAEDEIIVPGNYVLIEVIDTGSGIPKTVLGKIFEPFFSTKEIGSGTGLGLSTVYGIVKQTGGYIYVTSKEGQGTTFSIFLKGYDKSQLKEDNSQHEVVEKPAMTDLTGNGIILLVEDETPVRIFSSHALTNKGYTVLEACSGETALNIIAERGNEINVIITDVIMPGMNGPAMIEEIAEKYPNIKVIFMSGYAEDIFIKTYGTERKFNFLPKPFTLKQLAGKVKEVMSNNLSN